MGAEQARRTGQAFLPPNTEIEVSAPGPYHGQRGVVIKSDPHVLHVCVDLYRIAYPVWFHKDELRRIGVIKSDIINRHIWTELINAL